MALGGAVLQDAQRRDRGGARRARAGQRAGASSRRRTSTSTTRVEVKVGVQQLDGRRHRDRRQARLGDRRGDALRGDARVGRDARAARAASASSRGRSAPISARDRPSRRAAASRRSAARRQRRGAAARAGAYVRSLTPRRLPWSRVRGRFAALFGPRCAARSRARSGGVTRRPTRSGLHEAKAARKALDRSAAAGYITAAERDRYLGILAPRARRPRTASRPPARGCSTTCSRSCRGAEVADRPARARPLLDARRRTPTTSRSTPMPGRPHRHDRRRRGRLPLVRRLGLRVPPARERVDAERARQRRQERTRRRRSPARSPSARHREPGGAGGLGVPVRLRRRPRAVDVRAWRRP